MSLLRVDNLSVTFATQDGDVEAVKNLSFELAERETLGIVGESGSGKSQSMLSLIGLLAANGRSSGSGVFDGRDLLALGPSELRGLRGNDISMIFQDSMTSLNPYMTIGAQLGAVIRAHEKTSKRAAHARIVEMLEAVQIPEAAARVDRYPHELSGGMRQRVMIAASLLLNPRLLIADEPTTALDVTVQAQILELMRRLRDDFGTAIILITHDLGVVAGLADRVLVMQDGEQREQGRIEDVFYRPQHAYTQALLAAVPRIDSKAVASDAAERIDQRAMPLLEIDALRVEFPVRTGSFGKREWLRAVNGVSLELQPGETLGVVGESGCGKSTLARAVLKLVPVSGGKVTVLGQSIADIDAEATRAMRRDLQIVFQDPLASLNPRMTVGDIVAEPLWTHRPELRSEAVRGIVADVLERVGLSGRELNRYPHEFSGGQCQRIGIARALVLRPKLIICDEPVSALDVSIQAQIVELLMELRREFGLSLIFIAHDLAVVRQISDRVLVMYLGRAMEVAQGERLYEMPRHPYTRALLGSVPIPDPDAERNRPRELLSGDLPSPLRPPSGCCFRTRCRFAVEHCAAAVPELHAFEDTLVACHRVTELVAGQYHQEQI
jgi:peptide/nickel transport system ATP-binding protein